MSWHLAGAVMTAFTEIAFEHCAVRVFTADRFLETRFPDGAVCPATPEPTPDYLRTALDLGYGASDDPQWALCLAHELAHTYVAERFGWPHSIVLWAVAHKAEADIPSDVGKAEEEHVFDFQRLSNGFPPRLGWSHRAVEVWIPEFRTLVERATRLTEVCSG
jgi:hypothetical protein